MSHRQRIGTILTGVIAIAAFVAPAGGQVTSWPNSLSMTVDVTVNPPKLTMKVGPVAPNAWVAFLGVQGNKLRHVGRANAGGYYTVSFPTTVVPVDFELAVYSLSNGTPSFEGTFIATRATSTRHLCRRWAPPT